MLWYVKEQVLAYSNPEDAAEMKNSVDLTETGLYYIAEEQPGALLIKRSPESAGYWILYDYSTPIADLAEDAVDIYYLPYDSYVYSTAADSVNRAEPLKTYSKGYYYIYKTSGHSVNISNSPINPGGWIAD